LESTPDDRPLEAGQPPLWARLCDALAVGLLLMAVWIALTGGSRHLFFDVVVSLRSALLFLYAAAAILAVRHLVHPRPTVLDHLRALDAAITARPALAAALRAFLATRITVLTVGLFAVVTFGFPPNVSDLRVSNDPLGNLPARYDAGWYGSIALDGYSWQRTFGLQQDIAFFPALPLLSRAAGTLFGLDRSAQPRDAQMARVLWGGMFVSAVAFLWGLSYFVRLGQDLVGDERARHAALLLAAYPFSVFYSAPYTEALFLLGAVAACFHFRRGEWLAAGCWGLLVGLTRPNGCFLSIALAFFAWEQVRDPARRTAGGWSWRALMLRLGVAAMPGIGMLIFTAYLHQITGVWFAWARNHAAWGRKFAGLTPFTSAFDRLSSEPLMQVITNAPYETLNTVGLLFAGALLWPTFRRLGAGWGMFVVVNVASPLMAGGVLSMGRLTSTLFPLFLALALVLPPRAIGPCAVAFGILQGLCAALFFTWRDLY
jgi:hypothetical protein